MSGLQYTPQYGAQYGAGRPAMPSPQGYAHTAGRSIPPTPYGQRPPSTVPVPLPHGQYRPTPPGQSSRPPNPYTPGYGSQLARSSMTYGQGYAAGASSSQQRPGYPQGTSPSPGYAANYRPGQPPARPVPGAYPHTNGVPSRTPTQAGYYGGSQPHVAHASYGSGAGATQSQQRAQGKHFCFWGRIVHEVLIHSQTKFKPPRAPLPPRYLVASPHS
jgi:hypothetical protein